MSDSSQKIAILTGGSSGIGRCAARSLADKGVKVYELSRRDVPAEGITHIYADVSDEASVIAAVETVISNEGRIDILVNCAGFGISGAVEFTETKDAIKQLDVNFFGIVRTCHAVLPHMRKAGKGRIVNISSVAAPIPIPFQTYYSASKAAINSYTAALANEVRPYGITVCAVMPGDIASGFTDAREKTIVGDEEYGGRIEKSVKVMEKDEREGASPEQAGAFIAHQALKKNVKPYVAIGFVYKLFTVIMKFLPIRFTNWLLYQIYAK
ncbi:MAG: SDR family oxidoreductase [Parasporobacterium sp.]|nr:SDR family oxidoreductase [Parasporobacterium sp.]